MAAGLVPVLLGSACGAADPGRQPIPQTSVAASASQKLHPALAAKLPQLPADQTVRLVATLEPGVQTDRMREELTRLGGKLVERFTIVDAIVVDVPARSILSLAALPQVKGLELDDTGVPPPSTR